MKNIKYLLLGVLFGIIMTKSEVVSWFRIQEMFQFGSFHMYGIIGTAVILGATITFLVKQTRMSDLQGERIAFSPKAFSISRYLVGGTIFGLGWAMTGACPGPMFTLVGHGFMGMILVIFSAVLGTYAYGATKDRLPH